jgi:hypothetical protein
MFVLIHALCLLSIFIQTGEFGCDQIVGICGILPILQLDVAPETAIAWHRLISHLMEIIFLLESQKY